MLSLSKSISLKTLVVGGESPMLMSSTSKSNVAPPGITFPAPRSPYPKDGGIVSLRFSPEICIVFKFNNREHIQGKKHIKRTIIKYHILKAQ